MGDDRALELAMLPIGRFRCYLELLERLVQARDGNPLDETHAYRSCLRRMTPTPPPGAMRPLAPLLTSDTALGVEPSTMSPDPTAS